MVVGDVGQLQATLRPCSCETLFPNFLDVLFKVWDDFSKVAQKRPKGQIELILKIVGEASNLFPLDGKTTWHDVNMWQLVASMWAG